MIGIEFWVCVLASIVIVGCMYRWPIQTSAAIILPLAGFLIYLWWTDPALHDKSPPWEHCDGGQCTYDRDMMMEITHSLDGPQMPEPEPENPQISI